MGREANVRRERSCKACEETFYTTADEIKDHADTCRRLKDLGLVAPSSGNLFQMRIIEP